MFGSLTGFDGGLFDELRRLQEEVDNLFDQWPAITGVRSISPGTFPALNVGATPDRFEVYLFAAGLDPRKLELSIQQNLLTVAGKRELPVNERASYYRRERFAGEFRRVITLPEDADPDRVEARYRDGVLHISVQRKESAKPRTIALN
ncbi:MAG: Hsp20/alpha crystallin family protein [Betaproteobacteria bacterium]|nr:Hsp20/alpha crystallin family protein [Betaproteobacteria bacterium]